MRELLVRRYWDRVRRRSNRWRVNTPIGFIDYFPDVPGTVPEKMVFNELVRRGVNFYYNTYFGDIPFSQDVSERYRPDFLLPDYRIIIEPQGVYWHTRPGKYELDAVKFSMLIAAGYKVYTLTDTEILADVRAALDKIPELVNPAIRGDRIIVGEQAFNPLASLISRIKKRPKIPNITFKKQKRFTFVQKAGIKEKREVPVGPMFKVSDLPESYLRQLADYSKAWLEYLAQLEAYFTEFPEARRVYPEIYRYWLRWRGWWDRFQ